MKKLLLITATFITLNIAAQNVGIGTTTPQSKLSVGASSQFQVDSIGNIKKINNVQTSFPATQGGSGQMLTNDGTGQLTWSAYPNFDYAYFSEETASGVGVNSNYTIVANTWTNRHLNTTRILTGTSISRIGDSVLLQAGIYRVRGTSLMGLNNDYGRARFRNITDNTTALLGTACYSTGGITYNSDFDGYVSITSAKYFTIQIAIQSLLGYSIGSGGYSGFGETELHGYVIIERIK